jgi:acetyl-CoA carboxylase alpha subunit
VAEVVLLTAAGLHVPVILFVDVVGSAGAVAPEQIGAIAANVGTTLGLTVTFKVAVVAH